MNNELNLMYNETGLTLPSVITPDWELPEDLQDDFFLEGYTDQIDLYSDEDHDNPVAVWMA